MILFPDTTSSARKKLEALLAARPEPVASNVTVSNLKDAKSAKQVVINQGPENDRDTINTAFVRVNIYAKDEGDAVDLVRLVRALMTGRGLGSLCDGNPFVYGDLNAGPTDIQDGTDHFHWYMVFELRSRGTTLHPA